MRVHKLSREDGRLIAFEIENFYIRPSKIAVLLCAIDGTSNIVLRKPFSSSSDVHLEFKYRDEDFMVWEPYGDNSRYWIGSKQEESSIDISPLVAAFENYHPPLIIKILGDIIHLNFKALMNVS